VNASFLLQRRTAEPGERERSERLQSRKRQDGGALPRYLETWWPVVELSTLTRAQAGHRCIGITGVDGHDGVSTYARMIADVFARSGRSTLLVDLSCVMTRAETPTFWSPLGSDVTTYVAQEHEPAVLVGRPNATNRLHFHDAALMRRMFTETLASYEAIIVDLAMLAHPPANGINPLPTAAACDAVILVGSRGRMTQASLQEAVDLGTSVNVHFAGVVFNDHEYTSPATEMSQAVRSALRFVPPLGRWAQRKILQSSLLN
jgi:Mrp family chromosome partitioning ATPase